MTALIARWARHLWLDQADARRALPAPAAEQLRQRVAASEQRHTGQIRICIEGGLPASYLWRHLRDRLAPRHLVRQRAVMMFSKLRVWDTEHNNGVLIYLLLAEHAIELVADRGLTQGVDGAAWRELTARLEHSLRAGHFEQGLSQAVDDGTALLVRQCPRADAPPANELPDEPVFR